MAASLGWPGPWPHTGNPGVYLIFGSGMQLLYVGKATRLDTYFRPAGDDGDACRIHRADEWWRARPEFVATIACDVDKGFEAPALGST